MVGTNLTLSRIKKNNFSTKPRLLPLILGLLRVKSDFCISALEQRLAQQVRWHQTVSGIVCPHPGHSQYLWFQSILEGKTEGATENNWLRKGSPFYQYQSQHSAAYLLHNATALLPYFKPGVLRKNNLFSSHYALQNTLAPAGQVVPAALSGLGPFCDAGRCMVLCQWRCCTGRRQLQLKTGRLGLCLLGRTVQSESKAAKPAEQQRWSYSRKVVVSISQLSGNTCMCPGIHVYVHCCLLNIINSSVLLVVVPPPPQHLDSRANRSHFSVCCSLPCRCRMGTSRSVIGTDVAPAAEAAPAAGRCKAGCPREH